MTFFDSLEAVNYVSEGSNFGWQTETKIPHRAFYNNDPQAVTAYEVLEQIALYYGVSIYQSAGARFVFSPITIHVQKARAEAAARRTYSYRNNGALISSAAYTPGTVDLSVTGSERPRGTGGIYSYSRPVKKVERKLEYKTQESLGGFQVFTHVDFSDTFTGATHSLRLNRRGDRVARTY